MTKVKSRFLLIVQDDDGPYDTRRFSSVAAAKEGAKEYERIRNRSFTILEQKPTGHMVHAVQARIDNDDLNWK